MVWELWIDQFIEEELKLELGLTNFTAYANHSRFVSQIDIPWINLGFLRMDWYEVCYRTHLSGVSWIVALGTGEEERGKYLVVKNIEKYDF